MKQGKGLNRGTFIAAAVAVIALAIVAATPSNRPASASMAQATQDVNNNAQQPDKTSQPGNDNKITICHIPPGNPGNGQTLTISANAWKTDGSGEGGHGPGLHGGDYVGPCVTNAGTAPATLFATGPAATAAATESAIETCGLDINSHCPVDNAPPPARVAWVPVLIKTDNVPPSTNATQAPVVNKAAACVDWTFYHSDRTGDLNIFRLGATSANTSADIDVSKGSGDSVQDRSPASSPDGQYVAFTTNRNGNWEIYVGATDGSTQQRVTYTHSAANISPMWSPNGKFIAYETTRSGSRDIYLFDVVGGQDIRLTDVPGSNVNPFWSPDSQKILAQTNRDGLWQIYELTVSSKTWKRLSNGENNDINPQYSHDGKQIVFRSFSESGSQNISIYTMSADGSNRMVISDPKGDTRNPSWSPDNKLIAYQSNLKGAGDIYVYEVSTRLTRQITDNTTLNSASTWHCNTSTLIYTSVVNGKPQLYQVSALPMDAKPVRAADSTQLTDDNASNSNPQGSPSIEDASHRTQEGRATNR